MKCLVAIAAGGLLLWAPAFPAPIRVTDGAVEMRLDPAAPELTCVVVRTSGDAARDDAACHRAAEDNRTGPLPYPTGTYLYGDADLHPAECRLKERPLPARYGAMCAAHVRAMRKARFPRALERATWLAEEDLAEVPGRGGSGIARLGINEQGAAAYCVPTRPSGNPSLDAKVCAVLLRHAHYEPALDSAGEPTPATDHFAYVYRK
jgi:hypothetical protein